MNTYLEPAQIALLMTARLYTPMLVASITADIGQPARRLPWRIYHFLFKTKYNRGTRENFIGILHITDEIKQRR